MTSRFDCVFWSGDLNFRLEKERERLDRTIEGIEAQELPDFTDLMVHDELFRIRNEGKYCHICATCTNCYFGSRYLTLNGQYYPFRYRIGISRFPGGKNKIQTNL